MKPGIIFIALFLVLPAILAATIPPSVGYVNDFANVIAAEDESRILTLIQDVEKTTTAEIAVVTIPSLEGDSIERFTNELFSTWGIGKQNDNGILLLIAIEDRAYRFEVGYGLEGLLNDAKIGRIGREALVPPLKEEKYGEGVYQALLQIQTTLQGQGEVIAQNQAFFSISWPNVLGVLIYFFIIGSFYIYSHRKKKEKYNNYIGVVHLVVLGFNYFLYRPRFYFMLILTAVSFFIILATLSKTAFGGIPGRRTTIFGPGGWSGRSSGGFGGFGGGSSGGGGAGGKF